jgi:hypothetical protein
MGEVYRADDLKLGQTVALKFLPRDLSKDPQRLEYFLNEVRLTRQISHPNVCRVYDIGEFDGQHFLSMEYIDGEDLRVLLRRIGRLPHDKGVQIAQQLCAGLAAAHERGVLHRDLKPANIMIDGHGHVRITDFGLARLAEEAGKAEVVGTPAYMAPEQLTLGEATIQSDLFALGLILSEIFTGRAVLKASSIHDLIRAHESSLSQSVTFTDDIDSTVQQVIRRCLEREPHDRPASALVVAAGLPGGDPLAAALAAGETPSPEMVAASGEKGQLTLRTAGISLTILLVGLTCLVLIMGRTSATIGLDRSADGYAERVRKMVEDLGLGENAVHEDWGFAETKERPKTMEFWYRRSPQRLSPILDSGRVREARVVALNNPPPLVPGMVTVRLNGRGLLRELLIIPPSPVAAQDAAESVLSLLKKSGLIAKDSVTYENEWKKIPRADWMPLVSDTAYSLIRVEQPTDYGAAPVAGKDRATSDGSVPSSKQVNLAELDGRIVFFHVVDAAAPTPQTFAPLEAPGLRLGPALSVLVTLIAMVLAWKNVLAGRSDLRGGRRFALIVFVASFADSALGSVLTPGSLFTGLLLALASAVRFWIYYVALEPLARRYWPELLVNWSRGLAGRVRNPGIGRDILYGTLTAILFTLIAFGLLGVAPKTNPQTLCGTRFLFAQLAERLVGSLGFPLQMAVVMILVRFVVRNKWVPVLMAGGFTFAWHPGLLAPLWTTSQDFGSQDLANILAYTMYYVTAGALIARFGVLAASSFMLCHGLFRFFPWTADLGGPDLPGTVFAVIAILSCALYGFYTSVGGPTSFRNLSMNVT